MDLACLNGEDLELIELKVDSNTPLFAAVEVLEYGLVYRFSRKQRDKLGYTLNDNPLVFKPRRVVLKVLAPSGYYEGRVVALKGIQDGIGEGLAALPEEGYQMTFLFEKFPQPPKVVDLKDAAYFKKVIADREPVTVPKSQKKT